MYEQNLRLTSMQQSMENFEGNTSSFRQQLSRNGRRLLLFPLPLQGHISPMFQLADILYTKGFSITIIHTHFNSPNPSNYPHFTFKPINDGFSAQTSKLSGLNSVVSMFKFLNETCGGPLRDCLDELLADDTSVEPISCLITDAMLYFTQAVADDLKLKRIVLRTSSLSAFLVYAALPFFFEKGYFHKDWQSEERVLEFPELKLKDILKMTSNPEAVCSLMPKVIKETKAASGIIWNTTKELEEPAFATISQNFAIPNFPIGPFNKYFPASSSSLMEQDRSFMSWLDVQQPNSVIYVSCGSLAEMNDVELKKMAKGLANSMRPFLWVVRPGSVNGSNWIELLPDGFLEEVEGRGWVIKWAPQQEVLAHPAIGTFWTHCGWNSTLESICEGVPMICSPCFTDQPINSRYVDDVWKIGVYLDKGLEGGEIERAIERVMTDEEGKEMKERINCLKEKLNLSREKGGSTYQYLESLVDYMLSF